MEFWQIVINIAVLVVLFWWVWRGATGTWASKEEIIDVRQEMTLLSEIMRDRIAKAISLPAPEPKPEKVPGEAYLAAIREGANIAQANFSIGAQTVLDALHRDGRIAAADAPAKPEGAVNIGEEDYEIHNEDPGLPSIIVARNQRMAEQIGDRLTADIMRTLDEKI